MVVRISLPFHDSFLLHIFVIADNNACIRKIGKKRIIVIQLVNIKPVHPGIQQASSSSRHLSSDLTDVLFDHRYIY